MRLLSLLIGLIFTAVNLSAGEVAKDAAKNTTKDVAKNAAPKKVETPATDTKNKTNLPAGNLGVVDHSKDEPRTVPIPHAKNMDTVISALGLGIDIEEPVMKFNDVLLLLNRVEDIVVILMPELSSPEKLGQKLNFTAGRIALREFLNQVCAQVDADWKLDEKQAIILNAAKPIVLVEGGDPKKIKIDLDFAGEPLRNVLAQLSRQTGLTITADDDLGEQNIEMILQGWDIERILRYMSSMYNLTYQVSGERAYHLKKKVE